MITYIPFFIKMQKGKPAAKDLLLWQRGDPQKLDDVLSAEPVACT
jgi:hypothetical protein